MSVSHTGYYANVSVTTSASLIVTGTTLRKSVLIQNRHASNILYVGLDAGVTTSNGTGIDPDDAIEFSDYNGPIYGIASGAATDVRILEIGGP